MASSKHGQVSNKADYVKNNQQKQSKPKCQTKQGQVTNKTDEMKNPMKQYSEKQLTNKQTNGK
jgi:hypothetical protein